MPKSLVSWRFVVTAILLLVISGSALLWLLLGTSRVISSDPRIAYQGPFLNIHPSVQYVGDQACGICHQEMADSYHRHPMSKDLFFTSEATPIENFSLRAGNPFVQGLLEYQVEKKVAPNSLMNKVYHRESVTGQSEDGELTREWEVSFAMGSGAKARSYILNRNGYLFQSPITWYSLDQRWDLSPGYENRNLHFNRPVEPGCLFCHSNFADHVEGTVNRYRLPIFQGLTIGCERCHGPGQVHVQKRENGQSKPGPDDTIVNPARLEPGLREAICQQCHLQAEKRVMARDRKPFDFRPGLPLDLFQMDFINKNDLEGDQKFVSSVEQMHASACFRETPPDKKLGCTSCHDPHSVPEPKEKVQFYIDKCLVCHETRPCKEPRKKRLKSVPDDSCIACHMPSRGSEINHTAITDHRVPRKADPGRLLARTQPRDTALPEELIPFHESRRAPGDGEAQRNRGLAIMGMLDRGIPMTREKVYAAAALPLLEKATLNNPTDWPALESQADALTILGYRETALPLYLKILEWYPDSETAQFGAGILLLESGQLTQAATHLEKALRINPFDPKYYRYLATVQLRQNNLEGCEKSCRSGVELDPSQSAIWSLLIDSLLAQGKEPQARQAFTNLEKITPVARRMELQKWWENEKKRLGPR